jgi:hypothetical protein
MITCPKCQSTLPDWATTCQFCGTDVAKVARPAPVKTQKKVYGYGPAPWVWVAYYLIGGWWVLSGGFHVFQAAIHPSIVSIITCIFAGFQVLLGIGLILRIEAFRAVVHFFAWVWIALRALDTLFGFGMIFFSPLIGILMVLWGLFDIVVAGLLIYLIGETDGFAPT